MWGARPVCGECEGDGGAYEGRCWSRGDEVHMGHDCGGVVCGEERVGDCQACGGSGYAACDICGEEAVTRAEDGPVCEECLSTLED
jgi:hypothetical protein